MSAWEDNRDNHLQWQLTLGQLRYLPLRCWCTIVSMKPWHWVLLIGTPSGLALAAYKRYLNDVKLDSVYCSNSRSISNSRHPSGDNTLAVARTNNSR